MTCGMSSTDPKDRGHSEEREITLTVMCEQFVTHIAASRQAEPDELAP